MRQSFAMRGQIPSKSNTCTERMDVYAAGISASNTTAGWESSYLKASNLMEAVVERENIERAYRRVVSNKGSAGIDKMPVDALQAHLEAHWPLIREELLEQTYRPAPVREVEIEKPSGGMRKLGIPTGTDRLIQQALHQVLVPIFDPHFSESSHGFRRGRSSIEDKPRIKRNSRFIKGRGTQ